MLRDVQQSGFSTLSLTGVNDVPDVNETVGNAEPPHCPEHLPVPIASLL